ncbi:CIS tube protein [Ketobacter alkanivorans]|uniref:CIS tube protein n=1 Tax=Ketobacter alkanivorans TaxID=1917421 RepID=UPI0018F7FE44|nr:hypothetical protein [Ketobacter alkanivorans]
MNPERGKLIPVSGNNNTPDMNNAVDVQFNPTTLKVSLSNTLKENQRNGNSRSTQYVDKSSSSLTVELIFDTTYIEAAPSQGDANQGQGNAPASSSSANRIEQGSDVRDQTKKIAERFLKPIGSGSRMQAPKRCLFQWGSFEFVGLVESYEETLDFFSKEGRPLRATVSLKLKEDRYQFRQRTSGVAAATQDTPTLSSTGNTDNNNAGNGDNNPDSNGAPRPDQNTAPVPGASDNQPGNWRDTAMYNGVENPRLPSASTLAVPNVSASSAVGAKAGFGMGASVGAGVSISSSVSVSSSATPAYRFGASASLGTKVEGAFSAGASTALNAGNLANGSVQLRSSTTGNRAQLKLTTPAVKFDGGVGFD